MLSTNSIVIEDELEVDDIAKVIKELKRNKKNNSFNNHIIL